MSASDDFEPEDLSGYTPLGPPRDDPASSSSTDGVNSRPAADDYGTDPAKERAWWDEDDALGSLTFEREVKPEESNAEMARRILDEAAPMAAHSIVQLALHSANDNTRLNAAKFVTEVWKDPEGGGSQAALWEKMLGDTVSELELHANTERSEAAAAAYSDRDDEDDTPDA